VRYGYDVRRVGGREQRGFVAIEWVAAVALLLFPIVVLVATLPAWAERRHAAVVAAREAVRDLANQWPNANPDAAVLVADDVAIDHGVDAGDVRVRVPSVGVARGDEAVVEVEVTMPAISFGGATVGAWHYTARAARRIDDFRTR
jgi:hypothetical protein